ncbi:hypothetical protein CO172_02525 [Candidatus Uhrbacteria bacterium CG_4_9_14_3_um_filter_36_7]|uniref:Caib/baif family protein n=1 Tax=Candidatus Uhrbacteria bacterium CG_4_9_14_3_um_filter_36_7 TaxID=1975033 RepID=A0A2M7XH95_9BACT|nr:MAG: hypothetical protein CO172_02525 [Candidatus Uhrbacteria bacterium CG_4_9_14_3_um_filter_36_7]
MVSLMSKTPNYDAKVKAILDATMPGERVCALTGEKWNMTEEEIFWYKKFNVPPLKFCPKAIFWKMSLFWLTFSWWWNKHAQTNKPILTYIHPATGTRVLPDKEWFEKDFTSEGKEVIFDESFMRQLHALQIRVPLLANQNIKEPHKSICMFSFGDIESYFVMFSQTKNTFFSSCVSQVEDSSEIINGVSIAKSFDVLDSQRIYNGKFIRCSFDCMNSSFLFDCRNCEYCFGATNKRNRKYLWWNEQLSKEEWEKRQTEVNFRSHKQIDQLVYQFKTIIGTEAIWPENFNEQAINSTGEYLTNVTNVKESYLCLNGVHDCFKVIFSFGDSHDCAFCTGHTNLQYSFCDVNGRYSLGLKYTNGCQNSQNLEYCVQCFDCENCFGCVGLYRNKFCILNKKYTEEEYWQKLDQIKTWMLDRGEYGEFLTPDMSFNPFSDSGAPIYLCADDQVCKLLNAFDFDVSADGADGLSLQDHHKAKNIEDIPDNIDELDADDWVGIPIFDRGQNRYFAFLRPEIEFYKTYGIAPPNRHYIARMNNRTKESNAGMFEQTTCKKCSKEITIALNQTYPNRLVYCKECYLKYLEEKG